eukprot:gene32441-31050_t
MPRLLCTLANIEMERSKWADVHTLSIKATAATKEQADVHSLSTKATAAMKEQVAGEGSALSHLSVSLAVRALLAQGKDEEALGLVEGGAKDGNK